MEVLMSNVPLRVRAGIGIAAAAALLGSGCAHGAGVLPASPAGSIPQSLGRTLPDDSTSVLKLLKKQVVIGSTSDPKLKQLNPYGLTVAPATAGDFTAGDLVVCNFNAKNNVQGTGYTIVALHPKPGSKPLLVSDSKTLRGCASLALSPSDDIWAAAFSADDNPVISAAGKLEVNIKGKDFDHPWGQVYAQPKGGSPVFYETNAGVGTVVRINLGSKFTYDVIAKGFAVNHGKPGSIFAPAGLSYDASNDTLYITDGTNNTVVAFSKVTKIPAGGIIVEPGGKTFKGPSASHARLVLAGTPLDGPISSTLLFNGNLVVGNTSNPSGQNLMVELTPAGKVLDVRNVDKGAAGALFGIVATGTSANDTKVYFNDDNDNNLQVLER
jgi:hypothetical protein